MGRLTGRFAILAALSLCPVVGHAQPVVDPYPPPPGAVLPPPPHVPPVLPIAPPRPPGAVLLIAAPPPPPGAVLPIAPPPPPPLLPGPPPPPISPMPHLVPAPAWEEPGCPADCENAGAQLAYAPTPPMRTERVRRYGLMSAGLVIFGITWSSSALTAIVSRESQLFVPVVGPIFAAVDIGRTNDASPGRDQVIATLTFDTIAQTAGLVMAIVGASTKVTVRKRPVTIVPTGAGVYGRF